MGVAATAARSVVAGSTHHFGFGGAKFFADVVAQQAALGSRLDDITYFSRGMPGKPSTFSLQSLLFASSISDVDAMVYSCISP